MGIEWYDRIALRNGGYKSNAVFTVEGLSAETVFEERLVRMLPSFDSVLDAGCGHGEFTLKMSGYARKLTGFDNSAELLRIARNLHQEAGVPGHVEFVYATTKTELPFSDNTFDLIYDRRGPTSIIDHPRILRPGGTILGIHTDVSAVKERLARCRYTSIEIEEFNEAVTFFPDEAEFAKFISSSPGSPDYTAPEMSTQLEEQIAANRINGRLALREHKFIWKARKPLDSI